MVKFSVRFRHRISFRGLLLGIGLGLRLALVLSLGLG